MGEVERETELVEYPVEQNLEVGISQRIDEEQKSQTEIELAVQTKKRFLKLQKKSLVR